MHIIRYTEHLLSVSEELFFVSVITLHFLKTGNVLLCFTSVLCDPLLDNSSSASGGVVSLLEDDSQELSSENSVDSNVDDPLSAFGD